MMPLASRDLVECRSEPALRPICPTQVPEATDEPGYFHRARASDGSGTRGGSSIFNAEWGAPYRNQINERDRPPRFLHLVLHAGEIGPSTFSFAWPGEPGKVPAGRAAKSLGGRSWGSRTGELVLAPRYPYGGLHGSHLIFRWREAGNGYVVSLHAWEPVEEAVAALRATVLSIP
jgi:hypothetical protein